MDVAYTRDKVYKDVGNRRQLFIDDDVIAVVKNVTRRLHSPVKHLKNPIIKRDKPWEGNTYFRNSCYNVVWDDAIGKFRCWYEDFYDYFGGHRARSSAAESHYAESDDGIEWVKTRARTTRRRRPYRHEHPDRPLAGQRSKLPPRSCWIRRRQTRASATR